MLPDVKWHAMNWTGSLFLFGLELNWAEVWYGEYDAEASF